MLTEQSIVDVDLFAGPGGWDVGAAMLGHRLVGFEWDADACRTARAAGFERQHVDVEHVDPRDAVAGWADNIGGLVASPPCQGFSTAGRGRSRDDSMHLLEELDYVGNAHDLRVMRSELSARMKDARTLLVLEPLRWAIDLRPRWLAWEQVPNVLPIWEGCATLLRAMGYDVLTKVLSSEQYGVPQVRRRAILIARRLDWGHASWPTPTHSRYYAKTPEKVDEGVLPWVGMAQALRWDDQQLVGFPRLSDSDDEIMIGDVAYRARDLRVAARPSQAITEKVRSWTRSAPAVDTALWVPTFNDQTGTDFDALWPEKRPSTAVAGRGLVGNPGTTANRFNGSTKSRNDGVKITVDEAAVLQTFPRGYPWSGTQSSQFLQVGNAVPPLMAKHVLAAASVERVL